MTDGSFRIDISMPALTIAQRDDMRRHVEKNISDIGDRAGDTLVESFQKILFISVFIAFFHFQTWFALFDSGMSGAVLGHGFVSFICALITALYHTRFFGKSATEIDRRFGVVAMFLIFWALANPSEIFGASPGELYPDTTLVGWAVYIYVVWFTSTIGFDVVNMFPLIAEELEQWEMVREDLSDSPYTASELLDESEGADEFDEVAIRYLKEVKAQGRMLIELEIDELLDER